MYTVYKITNTINNKYYIGVHKTQNPNDLYFGSGTAVKQAIKKYKKENFTKEILLITESKIEAYEKEKELTENFYQNSNYNMRIGGIGGFTKEHAKKGYEKSKEKLLLLGGKSCVAQGKAFGGVLCKNDPKICGAKGGRGKQSWKIKQEKSIG